MNTENKLVRLSRADLDWASELLTEAFLEKPPVTRLFDEPQRRRQASFLMRCDCDYALRFGEGYTTANREGVALWLQPGKTFLTPARLFRAGYFSAPFKLDWRAFRRLLRFAGANGEFHKKSVAGSPHYYLFVLGVKPEAQGKGVGGVLLREMLERIDREKLTVFLETQHEANVPFYQKFGFEIAFHDAFPKIEGLSNWAMLRKPAK